MTTQKNGIRIRLILLQLSKYLNNVSQPCRFKGISRQHSLSYQEALEKMDFAILVSIGLFEGDSREVECKRRGTH